MNRTMLSIGVACTVGLSLAAGEQDYAMDQGELFADYSRGLFNSM